MWAPICPRIGRCFVDIDLARPSSIDMEFFGAGDIGERVRFFKSPLYKDFVESRVLKLL